MKIIGLTGGIGTGKTTVSNYLLKKGFVVIDADKIAREIVIPGSHVLNELSAIFGNEILKEDGTLDRTRLAELVFHNKEKREQMNGVMHEEIIRLIENRIDELAKSGYNHLVFVDAPLLFETELDQKTNEIWVVDASDEIRIERIMKRDGLSRADILNRINAQMSQQAKKERAGRIIDNTGDERELYQRIDKLIAEYEK